MTNSEELPGASLVDQLATTIATYQRAALALHQVEISHTRAQHEALARNDQLRDDDLAAADHEQQRDVRSLKERKDFFAGLAESAEELRKTAEQIVRLEVMHAILSAASPSPNAAAPVESGPDQHFASAAVATAELAAAAFSVVLLVAEAQGISQAFDLLEDLIRTIPSGFHTGVDAVASSITGAIEALSDEETHSIETVLNREPSSAVGTQIVQAAVVRWCRAQIAAINALPSSDRLAAIGRALEALGAKEASAENRQAATLWFLAQFAESPVPLAGESLSFIRSLITGHSDLLESHTGETDRYPRWLSQYLGQLRSELSSERFMKTLDASTVPEIIEEWKSLGKRLRSEDMERFYVIRTEVARRLPRWSGDVTELIGVLPGHDAWLLDGTCALATLELSGDCSLVVNGIEDHRLVERMRTPIPVPDGPPAYHGYAFVTQHPIRKSIIASINDTYVELSAQVGASIKSWRRPGIPDDVYAAIEDRSKVRSTPFLIGENGGNLEFMYPDYSDFWVYEYPGFLEKIKGRSWCTCGRHVAISVEENLGHRCILVFETG